MRNREQAVARERRGHWRAWSKDITRVGVLIAACAVCPLPSRQSAVFMPHMYLYRRTERATKASGGAGSLKNTIPRAEFFPYAYSAAGAGGNEG